MSKETLKMKKSRFSEEQIVKALQEHEVGGKTIVAISWELGISQVNGCSALYLLYR